SLSRHSSRRSRLRMEWPRSAARKLPPSWRGWREGRACGSVIPSRSDIPVRLSISRIADRNGVAGAVLNGAACATGLFKNGCQLRQHLVDNRVGSTFQLLATARAEI